MEHTQIIQAGQADETRRRCMCVHLQLTENKSVKRPDGHLEYRLSPAMAASSTWQTEIFSPATYRPPDFPTTCFMDDFRDKCSQALTHEREIFLVGNINCNTMKSSPESGALKDLCSNLNLTQLITSATSETPQSSSYIDVIITSNSASIGEFNKIFSWRTYFICAWQGNLMSSRWEDSRWLLSHWKIHPPCEMISL